MAILKQRLNMKTSTGYDTVHLETSSDLVQRDDGTSVEDSLTTLTKNVTNLSTSVENVTNNITTEVKTIIQEGNAAHAETHATGGSDEITPDSIGALSVTGTAESAKKLETVRTFQVNLGSTSSAGFDGTANVTPGVTGTLGVSNGGTGKTTEPLALYNLINGCNTITSDDIVDTDVMAIGDVSAATGKSVTIEELKTLLGSSSSATTIPTTLGSSCNLGGYNWAVVYVTDDNIFLISTEILAFTTFSGFDISSFYAGSAIKGLCNVFLFLLRSSFLNPNFNQAVSNVYIPTYTEVYSTFTWTGEATRKGYWNGSANNWWLSSTTNGGSGNPDIVSTTGSVGALSSINTAGFRPCVSILRSYL